MRRISAADGADAAHAGPVDALALHAAAPEVRDELERRREAREDARLANVLQLLLGRERELRPLALLSDRELLVQIQLLVVLRHPARDDALHFRLRNRLDEPRD